MSKRKFSLLRRRAEFNTHYTILDIGTEFVKALIVKREDDKGIVIGAARVRQQLSANARNPAPPAGQPTASE